MNQTMRQQQFKKSFVFRKVARLSERFAGLCFRLVGLALVSLGGMSTGISQDSRPDLVFIIVDDLNDWLGCLGGHPDAKSPSIDRLASSGMLFTQAYCNAPQCRPSRTSLNHGVYPFKTGTYFLSLIHI